MAGPVPRANPFRAASRHVWLHRAWRTRRGARAGVAAVEFAMAGVLIVTLLMFVVEIGWQMAVGAALEHGARVASRYGVTGQTGSGSTQITRLTQIRQSVLDATTGLLNSAQLTVVVTGYGSFAASSGIGLPGAGSAGQVATYALTYAQPCIAWTFTPLCSFTHHASATVQNEPFPN